ncbi:hypothetical protein CEXT_29231 [Caerostris extrusa]|uniref:Uncharacterized protein n=1 Tax=Caerostris extrusa TaxID=172846 RepID=A0AAV4QD10_CAEEX|nr:hypothetical protein CEXT_29231 [Caerostris extrusa]
MPIQDLHQQDLCIQIRRKLHGSNSAPIADKKMALWFKDEERTNYKTAMLLSVETARELPGPSRSPTSPATKRRAHSPEREVSIKIISEQRSYTNFQGQSQ